MNTTKKKQYLSLSKSIINNLVPIFQHNRHLKKKTFKHPSYVNFELDFPIYEEINKSYELLQ